MSTPTPTTAHQQISEIHQSPQVTTGGFPSTHGQMSNTSARQHRASITYQGSTFQPNQVSPAAEAQSNTFPQTHSNVLGYNQSQSSRLPQGHVLPPFSSIQAMGASNVSSMRYQAASVQGQRPTTKLSGVKRPLPSSLLASGESSDFDEEDNGELPAQGLVAPWEVLRGLADVASRRAAKVILYGINFYSQ